MMIFGHNLDQAVDDDADLYLARIDPKSTRPMFNLSTDRDQLDLTPAGTGGQDVGDIDSRISRDNDYILIVFNQAAVAFKRTKIEVSAGITISLLVRSENCGPKSAPLAAQEDSKPRYYALWNRLV